MEDASRVALCGRLDDVIQCLKLLLIPTKPNALAERVEQLLVLVHCELQRWLWGVGVCQHWVFGAGPAMEETSEFQNLHCVWQNQLCFFQD